jgi:hypothetical protein
MAEFFNPLMAAPTSGEMIESAVQAQRERERQTQGDGNKERGDRARRRVRIIQLAEEIQGGPVVGQSGENKVITDEQLATEITRRAPDLRGQDQSWHDFVQEVRQILKEHAFFQGNVERGSGSALSLHDARGMSEARRQEVVNELLGRPAPASVQLSSGFNRAYHSEDFTSIAARVAADNAPPEGDVPAQLSDDEAEALRALLKRARETFSFLPRTSRVRNLLGRQIAHLGRYAAMKNRPPEPILREFTGLLAAAEAEVAGARQLMPSMRP